MLFAIISFSAFASECSDQQWSDCNDNLTCLAKLNGSCGSYARRLQHCPLCQIHDNEKDTLECFERSGC